MGAIWTENWVPAFALLTSSMSRKVMKAELSIHATFHRSLSRGYNSMLPLVRVPQLLNRNIEKAGLTLRRDDHSTELDAERVHDWLFRNAEREQLNGLKDLLSSLAVGIDSSNSVTTNQFSWIRVLHWLLPKCTQSYHIQSTLYLRNNAVMTFKKCNGKRLCSLPILTATSSPLLQQNSTNNKI